VTDRAQPLRVLVVEDSEDDAQLEMRMLRRGGFAPEWHRVQDLQALRQALEERDWDAVLSDFRLPRFSGVDALSVFRDSGMDVPFIFVSGTIGEETAVEAMKAGASDYVMKQNLARLAPVVKRELAQAAIRAEHRRAQVELQASRDRYVDLYEFAPVGYLTLSTDGDIEQLNLTGAETLGAPRDELVRARFSRFVLPSDVERWNEGFVDVLHRGGHLRIELVMRRAAGTPFFAQLDLRREARDGKPPRVRLAIADVTDRKEAEADMRRYESQLRQAQKMESVGTLAGGIAHDFNNILGALIGNVELALENAAAGASTVPQLQEIRKAGSRARTLVRQILTFSRHEPQELVTQPLQPVIEETHRLLRATLPAGVDLELSLPHAAVQVHADATQVQQVLMNLCTNAWHALQGGSGHIRIGLDTVELADGDAHRLPPGRYAHVWVSDTGCGMDAATRERIFEPFYTTKPVGQGTGLGLSVAHGIVVAHHGAIDVDSRVGEGTTFHLYFPVAQPQPGDGEAPHAAAAGARGHGEHVVYVDDDETMVVMVEHMLQRAGYRVSAFHSAQEAIDAVRQAPRDYDFVVTDFNMPECSGLDVAHALAGIRPDLPVAISSGYITPELRAQAREVGVRGLLEKENTFEELCGLVADVLEHREPLEPRPHQP
jgi:PAS domain S-box-containing protein